MTAIQIKDKHIGIIGLGISNIPLAQFLCAHGAHVTARDRRAELEADSAVRLLQSRGMKTVFGEDYLEGITEEVLFRTPGVRDDIPQLRAAEARGAVVTSEMELFFDLCPAHIIGVTGSSGKTTTTTIIYEILSMIYARNDTGVLATARRAVVRTDRPYGGREVHGGRGVFVGGNIGQPLLPRAEQMGEDDFAVVELSSFQLQTMKRSPKTALITNITPNHLNWHTDMNEYIDAKRNIISGEGCRHVILNYGCPETRKLAKYAAAPITYFTYKDAPPDDVASCVYAKDGVIVMRRDGRELPILPISDIILPGRHNVENYMAAIAAVYDIADTNALCTCVRKLARSFGGVAHRIELIRCVGGVRYYNSSIDSTPLRTAAALDAFAKERIVLICGGRGKGVPFEPLVEAVREHGGVHTVILTGECAEMIDAAFGDGGDHPVAPNIIREASFDSAVARARSAARTGDIVLLSPACTSFDAFTNFEERGNRFREIVEGFGG